MMRRTASKSGLSTFLVLIILSACISACKSKDVSNIGTFKMGERVQVGPIEYNVLESSWKPQLEGSSKRPDQRFLVVRVSAANNTGQQAHIPAFRLTGSGDKEYGEVTEGIEGVSNWLGMIRTVQPNQTQEGLVVFDAPMAAYKLEITDGGEVENEKHAFIEIPVHIE